MDIIEGQDRLLSRYLDHPYHVCVFVLGITQIFGSVYGRVAAWMVHVEIQVLREDPAMSPSASWVRLGMGRTQGPGKKPWPVPRGREPRHHGCRWHRWHWTPAAYCQAIIAHPAKYVNLAKNGLPVTHHKLTPVRRIDIAGGQFGYR